MFGPSRVSVCERSVWFETRITTGPAPMRDGDTETLLLVITPLSCTGTGGRGLSWKSLPPPQPTPTSPATGRLSRSAATRIRPNPRSEEHTSELQSHVNLVCRLLLE